MTSVLLAFLLDCADCERDCVAARSRHNSLFQLFWLNSGPGYRSLVGGRAASSLNFATTFATCTFNPSCFLALPSISQSHSLPHFATPFLVCDIRPAWRWWGCKNKWIEKSSVHAGSVLNQFSPYKNCSREFDGGRIFLAPLKFLALIENVTWEEFLSGGSSVPLAQYFVKKPNPCFNSCID